MAAIATYSEQAYERIRLLLRKGVIPPGHRVSELALSRALGMSKVPVRDAVTRLVGEGLLDKRPGLGTFVAKLDDDEVEEAYDLRIALETLAARRAAAKRTPNDLQALRECLDRMTRFSNALYGSLPDWDAELADNLTQSDIDLHLALFEAAHAPRLCTIARNLRLVTHLARPTFYGEELDDLLRRGDVTLMQHRQIIEAVEAGDGEEAAALTAAHVEKAKQDWLNGLEATAPVLPGSSADDLEETVVASAL